MYFLAFLKRALKGGIILNFTKMKMDFLEEGFQLKRLISNGGNKKKTFTKYIINQQNNCKIDAKD
jgi:hypothetical protein